MKKILTPWLAALCLLLTLPAATAWAQAGAAGHSIFARALLDALGKNSGVIEGQRLHQELASSVAYAAGSFNVDQVPEYAPIKSAGHEAGDFFFVKR